MTDALKAKTKEVLALSIAGEPAEERTLAKKKKAKVKAEEPEVEEEDEDTTDLEEEDEDEDSDDEDDDDDDEESEDEDDEDEDEDDEDEDEDEEEEEDESEDEEAEDPPKAKRKAPARTGVAKVLKLKGLKIKAKFIYEAMVAIFKANRKLKATDEEIAAVVQKAWPDASFEVYRVNADRKKYNKGAFQNQKGAPEKQSVEYDEKGKVRVREIPAQLKDYVKRGQPVSKTIKENKAKGLYKGKKAKK
jgi:cobalamin biosynthesis protein CobT